MTARRTAPISPYRPSLRDRGCPAGGLLTKLQIEWGDMHVLHLLNHTNRLNGHVHAAVDLACAQVVAGHEATIASGGGDFDALLQEHGVSLAHVDHTRRLPTLLGALWALARLVRKQRPDVVHAHMMTSAVLAWPICRLAGVPLVTTVHNEFEKSAILMGLGNRVIAVSEAVRAAMQKRGISPEKLRVVLNGTIGSARFDKRPVGSIALPSPSVLFVGGLHPRKGLPDLLKAFDIACRKHPAARLYVVGGGPFEAAYREMASSMDASAAIEFVGATDDAFGWMKAADILVLPSLADPAPLTICEAREAGCAVIGTRTGGIPELLEHGEAGILVPPQDPETLAGVLCGLLADPQELATWKARSQTRVDYLTIARVARDTIAIYRDAMRRKEKDRTSGAAEPAK